MTKQVMFFVVAVAIAVTILWATKPSDAVGGPITTCDYPRTCVK